MQGQKISEEKRKEVIGTYLGCLNYSLTSRLTGIAPNSVKNIINKERTKKPKDFAKLCTKNYKRLNKQLEAHLQETQNNVFLSASYYYLDNPYLLNQFMHKQDEQLIIRQKLLYDAKISALQYEAKRIERALFLRDIKQLIALLKEAEKDTKDYEPIDFNLLGKTGHYGYTDKEQKLSAEERKLHIKQIENYLEYKGYKLDAIDIEQFIADKDEAVNYYY